LADYVNIFNYFKNTFNTLPNSVFYFPTFPTNKSLLDATLSYVAMQFEILFFYWYGQIWPNFPFLIKKCELFSVQITVSSV